ncbi:MAG: hypothetical protein HOW97_13775 [Catenulispora sp.]|nr:hypothetical protein [Catenulispora sp.]
MTTDTLSTFLPTPGTIDLDTRPENTPTERERAMRYIASAAHNTDDALTLMTALGLVEAPPTHRPGRYRRTR